MLTKSQSEMLKNNLFIHFMNVCEFVLELEKKILNTE